MEYTRNNRRSARAIGPLLAAATLIGALLVVVPPAASSTSGPGRSITMLHAEDFAYGTYIIDTPGVYRLAEDISFNPNAPGTLTDAIDTGAIPAELLGPLELSAPVDAYRAGMPLFTQFNTDPLAGPFTPGGPIDPRYDPAAYGVGFFAAIAVATHDVIIDLNGYRIEQSAEHALLQRFFSVIELADQPFVPAQGPSGFGDRIESAERVLIKNGTIGRSAHHGIHGNGNANIRVSNVDFDGYEVAAIALNGVDGLRVTNVEATNRKDVPVLGTFSSARFIQSYVDHLVRTGSDVVLEVGGEAMSAADVQAALRAAVNNVHDDVVAGSGFIDPNAHSDEYAVFHNPTGLIDGNSYSFLVNEFGVAVGGFPLAPDDDGLPSRDISFRNVRVVDQRASVTEVPAIDTNGAAEGGTAVIDPVGAVFQVRNTHPDTGEPVTISTFDDPSANYTGNVVANAQALVAKAVAAGEFEDSPLDVSRINFPPSVLDWVEGTVGAATLADIDTTYFCNGDSMFHVNKGVIGFKMDAAVGVSLANTDVLGMENLGGAGVPICGDYTASKSHPDANLFGYGGASVRGHTFAGSHDVSVVNARLRGLDAHFGPAIGVAVLTDTSSVRLVDLQVADVVGGSALGTSPAAYPNGPAYAAGVAIDADAVDVTVIRPCAVNIVGHGGTYEVHDLSGEAVVRAACRS